MTDPPRPGNFDDRPPMPVTEYERVVARVNVGYDLLFTLALCLLRGLGRPDLHVLVVGAGGGKEVETFAPGAPGWRVTGVDPSADMLALAQTKADRLGVGERVTLVRGTVDDLPGQDRFDAATCIFVLHVLPREDQRALLRGIAGRLRPGAPLILVSGVADPGGVPDDLVRAWQQYGELMGMPPDRMAVTLENLLSPPRVTTVPTEDQCVRLLRAVGFRRVTRFFSALGVITGWIAR